MDDTSNINVYSPENLLRQAEHAPLNQGYKVLHFYIEENGTLARVPTAHLAQFYLSPSGGTLRDADLNIVLYSAKFDKFKGIGKT